MSGIVHNVMKLLLLSFIRTGVKGEDGLIFPERAYDIKFPCEEDVVCFHIWQISTSETSNYIAIVSNGEIQTAGLEDEDPKCSLQIKDLTAEDVGRHHCQRRPDDFAPYSTSPELNLTPGKTVTLQCVLLTYVEQRRCDTQQLQQVSLTWVDEAGAEIREDSQHHIKQWSLCNITLTVTFQSPGNMKFKCQATVNGQVQTSVELRVSCPAFKGKGRGLIIELEPENHENEGGNQGGIGVGVGVVGCVVVTALVAAFVVRKRRTSNQLPDESSCYTTSTYNVPNGDDVIYADIILPVGSDQVWTHEYESTEYACVQYK